MDPMDKAFLKAIYCASLDPAIPALSRIQSKLPISIELFNQKINQLIEKGLVEKNNSSNLTFIGRDAIKIVLVGGVFDLIHPGHIHTLKAAREHGDLLIVVVARTITAKKIKKNRNIYHNENLRKELVSSLGFVDLAVIGKEGTLYDTVEFVKPDIIALGYDQTHDEKEVAENCQKRNLNVRVVRLSTPMPRTKSSVLKDELGESFYRI